MNDVVKNQPQKRWKVRYTVLLVLWSGWMFSFLDRMVMSVSLPFIGKDLNLDPAEQGMIISAFFIGYAVFQIPGGFFSDKFGARKVMVIAITWWSIFTSLTGLILTLPLMLLVRFLFGVGEGFFPTSSWKMISIYFPSKERGRATAIQSSVNTLGPALAVIFSASIIAAFGWHMVFIILGIPGLIIAGLMFYYCRDNPKDAPNMTQEELDEITQDNPSQQSNLTQVIPFSQVLKQGILWKMSAIWFLFDITFWGFSTWLPSYLMNVRGFSLTSTGVVAAIPFLCGTVGTLIGGWYSDRFKSNRKLGYIAASFIAAFFLYMTFSVESCYATIIYQCTSTLFMFFAMSLFWGILMDCIAPNIMGRASGIVNFGGQLAGIVSPVIIGYLIKISDGNYDGAFICMIVALILSAAVAATISRKASSL